MNVSSANAFLAPALQQTFFDKTTGELLVNGIVRFFKDNARQEPKKVYTFQGNGQTGNFVSLGSEVTLNSVGSFNNVIYYVPFQELDVADTYNTTPETYFIEIFASDGTTSQGTIENYPDLHLSSSGTNTSSSFNYISNGQFLLHNDLPPVTLSDNTFVKANEFRADPTIKDSQYELYPIAYGGFYYAIANGADTTTDEISFEYNNEFIPDNTTPFDNQARYSVRLKSDTSETLTRALRIRFTNVNRFEIDGNNLFTLQFAATTADARTVNLQLVKNFGSNADGTLTPSEITAISPVSISANSVVRYPVAFNFGTNAGRTVGPNNDDFVDVTLQMPVGQSFNIEFSDFMLLAGDQTGSTILYPDTTNRENVSTGLGGGFPQPSVDGNDLLLTPQLTKDGWQYDRSVIGKIEFLTKKLDDTGDDSEYNISGLLYCDGSKYKVSESSPYGIPYKRLYDVLKKNDSTNLGIASYGTGSDYSTAYKLPFQTDSFTLMNNYHIGAVAAPENGTSSPGFTFLSLFASLINETGIGSFVYPQSSGNDPTQVFVFRKYETGAPDPGNVHVPSGVPSGLSVTPIVDRLSWRINCVAASAITAGNYVELPGFALESDPTSQTGYYLWVNVNGTSTDPAPSGLTKIEVVAQATATAADVSRYVLSALNNSELTQISTVDGSSIAAGSFFTFQAQTASGPASYYVWYEVDGSGVEPPGIQGSGIKASVLSTDSASDIANKTSIAINSQYFAVPNFRDKFIRVLGDGEEPTGSINLSNLRYSNVPDVYGDRDSTDQRIGLIPMNFQTGIGNTSVEGSLDWVWKQNAAGGASVYSLQMSTNTTVVSYIKY